MFCYYQERTTQPNDYTRENDEIIACNYSGKICPYSKLKKAKKTLPMAHSNRGRGKE